MRVIFRISQFGECDNGIVYLANMKSEEIRKRFLEFFKIREHAIIPSASLVPENDSSVLFTTAGMQPLVPYLLGENHPQGDKLVNVQKCVRTQDIEEVGDNTHDTFFEMLGNWSLGAYFKEEAIRWSYELLTSKDEGFGLDPKRLYITCFAGDQDAPKDTESAEIWKSVGIPEHRIYFFGKEDNWWSPGDNGPCGPDTEMFYDTTEEGFGDLTEEEFKKADSEQKIAEIWNDVFMEYEKKDGKVIGKLAQKNVDTGAGLERLAMVLQKKDNIFDTDLFSGLMEQINELDSKVSLTGRRIIADHIRTSVFIISDGVTPSNTDRGYILRALLRRAIFEASKWHLPSLDTFVDPVIKKYNEVYPNLLKQKETIHSVFKDEEIVFKKTLERGKKELNRLVEQKNVSGKDAFMLFSTHGLPLELTREYVQNIDKNEYEEEKRKHKEISRSGAEKKFKGGLADTSEMSVKYHTATHLLHQALRDVLGSHVNQKGSNITPERLRFDFNFERKMTAEEIEQVEKIVNDKIYESIPVSYKDIPLEEAEKMGAIGLFEEKYGDKVRVYKIGDYSLEYCGGPHVKNTSELSGVFKVKKEEAISQGVRRIKAILQ
jgi:alanyl-tRNA synthetase